MTIVLPFHVRVKEKARRIGPGIEESASLTFLLNTLTELFQLPLFADLVELLLEFPRLFIEPVLLGPLGLSGLFLRRIRGEVLDQRGDIEIALGQSLMYGSDEERDCRLLAFGARAHSRLGCGEELRHPGRALEKIAETLEDLRVVLDQLALGVLRPTELVSGQTLESLGLVRVSRLEGGGDLRLVVGGDLLTVTGEAEAEEGPDERQRHHCDGGQLNEGQKSLEKLFRCHGTNPFLLEVNSFPLYSSHDSLL